MNIFGSITFFIISYFNLLAYQEFLEDYNK